MAARLRTVLIVTAALLVAALLAAAVAQPYGPGAGIMGPGMMGSWMMGRRGFGGVCNPAASGFAEHHVERFEELTKPTDAQRSSFEAFKAASIKSADIMRGVCQAEPPTTIVGRTEAMERRADAMLQAVRTVRPALEAFYAALSDEQKARLDSSLGHGRFRHWRDRW